MLKDPQRIWLKNKNQTYPKFIEWYSYYTVAGNHSTRQYQANIVHKATYENHRSLTSWNRQTSYNT
jgi:hypothetical protein